MLAWHRSKGADITIATIQVPPVRSRPFRRGTDRARLPDQRLSKRSPHMAIPSVRCLISSMVSASMGIYIFNTRVLIDELMADAARFRFFARFRKRHPSRVPRPLPRGGVGFSRSERERPRVTGATSARSTRITKPTWIWSPSLRSSTCTTSAGRSGRARFRRPPAKFVFAQEGQRMGLAVDSIVSPGCIISGGRVNRSVLGPFVRVNSYCEIDESILLPARDDRQIQPGPPCHHRRRCVAAGKQQGRFRY